MNQIEFYKQLKKDFPKILDEQFKLFDIYKDFLRSENEKYNLTRLDTEELIYEKYFYNSIAPFIGVDIENKKILDIGSGSGVPGIILKVVEPTINLTILESNAKKMKFMQELCKLLSFDDVEFILERAEICAPQHKEEFDIVTSRAVSALNVLLEISCQFAKIGGLLIEPKSTAYEDELTDSMQLLGDFGLAMPEIKNYDAKNMFLYFKKIKTTNWHYPREWKEIIKNNKKENTHG